MLLCAVAFMEGCGSFWQRNRKGVDYNGEFDPDRNGGLGVSGRKKKRVYLWEWTVTGVRKVGIPGIDGLNDGSVYELCYRENVPTKAARNRTLLKIRRYSASLIVPARSMI